MDRFNKNDTKIIKGIGIILLILHHVIGGNPGIPMNVIGTPFKYTIGTAGKVCVALFMLLSGYGMMESSRIKGRSDYLFILARLKKLYLHFWGVFLVLCVWSVFRGINPFSDLYGIGVSADGPLNMLRDAFGFFSFGSKSTPTINGVFWFIEAIVIAYLLFPILAFLFRKMPTPVHILILLAVYLPWINYLHLHDYGIHTDRAMFYLFPFCLGMMISHHHLFDRLKRFSASRRLLSAALSSVVLIAALFIRQHVCLPFDPFFALAICIFAICTVCQSNRFSLIKDGLLVYGEYETDIYYLHPALLDILWGISFQTTLYRCIFTVLICLAVIYSYTHCKQYLVQRVTVALKQFAARIRKPVSGQ